MRNASTIADVSAVCGVLLITAGAWWLHPSLGLAFLGFCALWFSKCLFTLSQSQNVERDTEE